MRMVVAIGLVLLTGCSAFQSSREPAKSAGTAKKQGDITEMTCYQDCRNDLQTEEFCRARCSD